MKYRKKDNLEGFLSFLTDNLNKYAQTDPASKVRRLSQNELMMMIMMMMMMMGVVQPHHDPINKSPACSFETSSVSVRGQPSPSLEPRH